MIAAAHRLVERRAGYRCEYCQLHRDEYHFAFHIEHIIAQQHGGSDRPANLCFSCPLCNHAQEPNVAGYWRGRIVPLFNPRRQLWNRHFYWDGLRLVGRTLAAKVTIKTLDLNAPLRVRLRAELLDEGRFRRPEDLTS